MAIAMSIPIVLRLLFGFLAKIDYQKMTESFLAWIWTRPVPETEYYERTIIHKTEKDSKGGSFTNVDTDSNNHVLVKAIMMYLHHLQCLKLKTADLELTSIKAGFGRGSGNGGGSNYDYYSYDDESSDDEDGHCPTQHLVQAQDRQESTNRAVAHDWAISFIIIGQE
jgi:hypothetical protein